jgi:hypothetical protein
MEQSVLSFRVGRMGSQRENVERADVPGRAERWPARDWLAALVLFAATAATVLWQNAHVAVLWDISYLLDSSWRFALAMGGGPMPYRDFPFVHAPMTFLIQAAIIRVGGRVFFHHVLYAAVAGGLGTVLAWRIVLRAVDGAWRVGLLLAMPLTVLGVYGIYPTPIYDCDCILFVLLAVWLLGRVRRGGGWSFAAGVAAVVPVFCKQNIGVPFLLVVVVGAVVWLVLRWRIRSERRELAMLLAGVGTAMAAALLVLQVTCGVGRYFYRTVTFAAQRRLPGLGAMVDIYREQMLLWALPCVALGGWLLQTDRVVGRWVSWCGLALLAAPLVPPLVALVLTTDAEDRAVNLLVLWPLLLVLAAAHTAWRLWRRQWGGVVQLAVLAAIHGTMLSQQLWGSTYAIWPLWVILLAEMLGSLGLERTGRQAGLGDGRSILAAVVGVTLLVCGGLYTLSEDRLSYAQVREGAVVPPHEAALRGMSVRGAYMPEFEQLLDFAAREIPMQDGLILLPGEDPFYYATGRVPQFPVLLFDPATQPYSPQQVAELARARGIRWLVVKTHEQIKDDPMPDRAATLAALEREFVLYRTLDGYAVWRRRQ